MDFSKAERIDYAKRLRVIEELKAKERILSNQNNDSAMQNFAQQVSQGTTRDIVADKLGVGSGYQLEKEEFIVANKDSLAPEDFAEWDEGYKSRKNRKGFTQSGFMSLFDIMALAAQMQIKQALEINFT